MRPWSCKSLSEDKPSKDWLRCRFGWGLCFICSANILGCVDWHWPVMCEFCGPHFAARKISQNPYFHIYHKIRMGFFGEYRGPDWHAAPILPERPFQKAAFIDLVIDKLPFPMQGWVYNQDMRGWQVAAKSDMKDWVYDRYLNAWLTQK